MAYLRLVALEAEQLERTAQQARDATRLQWYVQQYGSKAGGSFAEQVKRLIDEHAQRKLRVVCGEQLKAFERCAFSSNREHCSHRWEPLSNCMRAHDLEYVRDAKDLSVSLRVHNFRLRDIPKYVTASDSVEGFDPSKPVDARVVPRHLYPVAKE